MSYAIKLIKNIYFKRNIFHTLYIAYHIWNLNILFITNNILKYEDKFKIKLNFTCYYLSIPNLIP